MAHPLRPVVPAAGALLAFGLPSIAGPLNPPAGPIVSTGRTLREVEPRIPINAVNTPGDEDSVFKITGRGSYYLTQDVFGAPGKSGIEVSSSGVTIDLSGFSLIGTGGSRSGIFTSVSAYRPVEISNGVVRGWDDDGITMAYTPAVIRNVRAAENGGHGISAYAGVISGCIAWSNGLNGIHTEGATTVTDCSAMHNADGIHAATGSIVSGCVASSNRGDVFEALGGVTFSACSARGNTESGFDAASGCTIAACSSVGNWEHGIAAGTGSTVVNNSSRSNQGDAIVVDRACGVVGNTCVGNGEVSPGGAGVRATGRDNRIEGNTCVDHGSGIEVEAPGNIIIRNVCSGNTTNWLIVADNFYGPIITLAGASTPGVAGDAAASSLATTDPHANFTY